MELTFRYAQKADASMCHFHKEFSVCKICRRIVKSYGFSIAQKGMENRHGCFILRLVCFLQKKYNGIMGTWQP